MALKESRERQDRAGLYSYGLGWAGLGKFGQGSAGQDRAGQGYHQGDIRRLLGRYTLDAHVVHAEFLSRPVLGFDRALFHFVLLQTDV